MDPAPRPGSPEPDLPPRCRHATLAAFLVGAACTLAHLVQVLLWSEPVPYWDQWDAEILLLLRPWVDGELALADMWAQHAEHRILLARVLMLALFELNGGQVDNVVEAAANTLLYGALHACLYFRISAALGRVARSALASASIALACLPFNWENTLVGFQGVFYLMLLATIVGICIAADHPAGWRLHAKVLFAAFCGIFSLASGVLMLPVIGAILALRVWRRDLPAIPTLALVFLLAGIFLAAIATTEIPEAHRILRAPSAADWAAALLTTLSWPFPEPTIVGTAVLWMPTAMLAAVATGKRRIQGPELAILGVAGVVLLQCAAIAYSRGHPGFSAASRYTDMQVIGLLANFAAALRLASVVAPRGTSALRHAARIAPAAIMGACATLAMFLRFPIDLQDLHTRHELALRQMDNVAAFLASGDVSALDRPFLHIPYHDGSVLGRILRNPAIRSMMPSALTAGTAGHESPRLGRSLRRVQTWLRRSRLYRSGLRSVVELAVAPRDARALVLGPAVELAGRFQAPRTGTIEAFGVMLGTYAGRSDGILVFSAGRGPDSREVRSDTAAAVDNRMLRIPLPAPLDVTEHEWLAITFRYQDSTEPLAVWMFPSANDSQWSLLGGDDAVELAGRSPRLEIEYATTPASD